MKSLFVTLIFLGLLPFAASASFDVNCNDDNCWTEGWAVTSAERRYSSEVSCVADSCFENGWIERINGRFQSEVECIDGSCWTNGFNTFNRDGRLVGSITCNEDPNLGPNCLTAGWIIQDAYGDTVAYSECVAGDCERYGWDIENTINGAIQIVRCKDDSCFTNGWTLRP